MKITSIDQDEMNVLNQLCPYCKAKRKCCNSDTYFCKRKQMVYKMGLRIQRKRENKLINSLNDKLKK